MNTPVNFEIAQNIFKMKEYIIIITADTNDGDYITEVNEITSEEIQKIKSILSKLPKDNKCIRWENGEMGNTPEEIVEEGILTEEEVEILAEYLPRGEYGIHTIESIEVLEIINKEILL